MTYRGYIAGIINGEVVVEEVEIRHDDGQFADLAAVSRVVGKNHCAVSRIHGTEIEALFRLKEAARRRNTFYRIRSGEARRDLAAVESALLDAADRVAAKGPDQ